MTISKMDNVEGLREQRNIEEREMENGKEYSEW